MATVYVGGASIDENGRIAGGKAGNQSGRELKKQAWYLHRKGWRVFRCRDAARAGRIARAMAAAIANRHIGYDQGQRNTLYQQAEAVGYNPALVTKDCETDCSALVRVCCAFAGITGLPSGFRTANEAGYLLGTGMFVELIGAKYQSQSAYLGEGDILVTKTSGHTVVVLNSGAKYEGARQAVSYEPGERLLGHGCAGRDVAAVQEALIGLGYDLGRYGADGDFGDCTELAVRAFQRDAGIDDDGVVGPRTLAALSKAVDRSEAPEEGGWVFIDGGNCYIRSAPDAGGDVLGVAKRGQRLPFGGRVDSDAGWISVREGGRDGWVSGKYAKREAVS